MDKEYVKPTIKMLCNEEILDIQDDSKEIGEKLVQVLKELNIKCDIKKITRGDVFTSYICDINLPNKFINEFEAIKNNENRLSPFAEFENYLELALDIYGISIIIPKTGNEVEIQMLNKERSLIHLKKGFKTKEFQDSNKYTVYLGDDVNKVSHFVDLTKLPHLLISGQTGTGKSVAVLSILFSLMYKCTLKDARFLLLDPKRIEYDMFNDSPFSLTKEVIQKVPDCIKSLEWAEKEMMRRMDLLSQYGDKDIEEFYEKHDGLEDLPRIFIFIDELADLVYNYKDEEKVTKHINRIARLARATGIHMIVCTQRPPCINYEIDMNLPAKFIFRSLDNHTHDARRACRLGGSGDGIFYNGDESVRLLVPFDSSDEYRNILEFLRLNNKADYDPKIEMYIKSKEINIPELVQEDVNKDKDIKEVIALALDSEKGISMSLIQRKLGFGWPRAAKAVDKLQHMNVLTPRDKNGNMKLLISKDKAEEIINGDVPVGYTFTKDMLQALTVTIMQKDKVINNVNLQLFLGWKSSRALKTLEDLSKLPIFDIIDEDTLRLNGTDKEVAKIIDNAEME